MKKYIKSATKEELIQQKNAWKAKFDARDRVYQDQNRNFRQATWSWEDRITSLLKSTFSSYIDKLPYLDITVKNWFDDIEIKFNYADHLGGREDENVSLRWSYEIKLSESGEVKTETNSWSGVKATTVAQIDDLMNSANLLRALVEFDWAPLLREARDDSPKYSNYVGIRDPRYDDNYKDPGYDKMIREAEIADIVGKDIWAKSNDKRYPSWYKIISETPAFYTYISVGEATIIGNPKYAMERIDPESQRYYAERVKKSNIGFAYPMETLTQDEMKQRIESNMPNGET